MLLAVQQTGEVAVLVPAAEEEAGHGLDLGDHLVGVGGEDVVEVHGDPLGVGRAVALEEPGVIGAVAGGVAAQVGIGRVGVLALGHGGRGDDADARGRAAGTPDDLAVDLGVVVLEAAADEDEGPGVGVVPAGTARAAGAADSRPRPRVAAPPARTVRRVVRGGSVRMTPPGVNGVVS